MQEWLIHILTAHPYTVYILIGLLSSAEGPIIAIIGGALVHAGYLPFVPLYFTLMVGDLIGDTFWYCMGRFFGLRFVKRFGKYVSVSEEGVAKVQRIFHKYTERILLVNKLTTGFGFAVVTLFTAGMSRIPFRKYILLNGFGQFFWTGLMISLGYFLGQAYESVGGIFGKMSIIALSIIFLLAVFGFGKYIYKKYFLS